MKIKIKDFAFLLLPCLLLASCIDEIKLNIGNDQQRLVVDGLIADSLQEYTIKVNHSAIIGSVSTDNVMTPVTGATVRVLDDAGGSFDFTETAAGIYSREMQGEVGKAYHVEVKTADGKTILSRPAVLQKSPPLLPATGRVIEEVTLSPSGRPIKSDKLSLEMNTEVPGLAQRPYLRWRAMGEYQFWENYPNPLNNKICYVKNNVDINNIKIFDTHDLAGGLLTNEPFLTTSYNYRFAFMYCFHLFQYAISEEEYDYWENVRDIVNIDGSLFDPPPGTVKGNLYNPAAPNDQILGYFSVAGVSYRRQFFDVISLGVYVDPGCHYWGIRPQSSECRACADIPMSSLTRPWYWEP
ncbi:MAG: DUF4249 domain-containing protein [Saprospiraceae bacterium]|nr:MAG: DUF4249 domain-containing protein [Saprospiraceae bacterium]